MEELSQYQSQSKKPKSTTAGARKEKITLECYLDFVHSRQQFNLKRRFLDQIIRMHGFKSMYGATVKVLTEAVNTIDLMDPSRCTLNDENMSPCACISIEDAIADLNELNWQECCITSIRYLNSSSWKEKFTSAIDSVELQSSDCTMPNSKTKGYNSEAIGDACDIDGGKNEGLEIGAKKCERKRKRRARMGGGDRGNHGSESSALVSYGSC